MDPNATLAELRELMQTYWNEGTTDYLTRRIAEAFESLDVWLTRGGFLPDAWGGSQLAGERFYA